MWSGDTVVPVESNNNNICADLLITNLVDGGTTSPADEQSNSSSLESLDSPLLDDNRALSTSCSEDSFEMSSTASRTATDFPTPSDSFGFHTDYMILSFDGHIESDPETEQEPVSGGYPELQQLRHGKASKSVELSFDESKLTNGLAKRAILRPKFPSTTHIQRNAEEVPKAECESYQLRISGHISPNSVSASATNNEEWKIHLDCQAGEAPEVNRQTEKMPDEKAFSARNTCEVSSTKDFPENSPATVSTVLAGLSDTLSSAIDDHLEDYIWRVPSTSRSMGCIGSAVSKEALQKSIDAEVNSLDTCLPTLDFNKLEEQLNCAARERQIIERKLLGEQVRRRLALQVDQLTAGPSPRVLTRPSKSNLGFRLQTAMNLQVCYMNDMDDDEDEDDDSSDDDFGVPKSKSAPNLRGHVQDGSSMNATQLRHHIALHGSNERRIMLEEETRLMLAKAKETAKMQMELEKLYAPRSSANLKKVTRIQLSKMTRRQLMEICDQLSKRIDEENAELMQLLVERDSLHMQQDSMLVDIEDMIQHESNSECLNLPEFLKVQASTSSKFRIFKR